MLTFIIKDAFASVNTRCEALKNEMRIRFRNRAVAFLVVHQGYIVEREGHGRAVRQMRQSQRCWCASVLVEQDNVCQAVRFGGFDEVGENEISSVEAQRRGKQQTDFFRESRQPTGRVSRRGDQDPRVA